MAQRFQFGPYFGKIVDLAVVDDGEGPVAGTNRLFAAIKIDYLQANCAQPNLWAVIDALLVGPPVAQRLCHPTQNCFVSTTGVMGESGYPAHRLTLTLASDLLSVRT